MSDSRAIFRSFLQAGFECSTHKLRNGKRLDLLTSTKHDRFAKEDYKRLQTIGIKTVRVAARWHRIEPSPGEYDFESLAVLFDAAAETRTEIVLDLLHFGWPDHVDIFSPYFVPQFGRFVYALTAFIKSRGNCCNMFAPTNEISFLSWAGGDKGAMNPHAIGRGDELKRVLVRAAITASEILLNELQDVRLISPEPVIHIIGNPAIPGDEVEAEMYRLAQFQAWDMVCGRMTPELGGRPEYLDIIGVNFYAQNQWVHNSDVCLTRTDPRYRPFHKITEEVWNRYHRPIFVSETGTENCARADWFNYVCDEVITAHYSGIPIHGICLYPILDHPGWEDDRHCCNGLFDYADACGHRDTHWPLANAILNQQPRLQRSYPYIHDALTRPNLLLPSPMGFCFSTSTTSNEPFRT